MKVLSILQVGDVHYSDAENFTPSIDDKDAGFPPELREELGAAPLAAVFRGVANVLDRGEIQLLSFMGDYTTRGDPVALSNCLAYLRRLLPEVWKPGDEPCCQLLIGNHDIDRKLDPNSDHRFDLINEAITEVAFPIAPIDSPVELVVTGTGPGSLAVFGLNTCRGCGQLRLLGPLIEKSAGAGISDLLKDPSTPPDVLDEIIENIDTPAVSDSAIAELVRTIGGLGETALPIVSGHHNLLPQATPRIAPYAELINGGSLRMALLAMDRPLLFLHGHLHTDPVEIVRVPSRPRAAIISIAAPIFRDGFNVIRAAFNADGVPLGCHVELHRLDGSQITIRSVHSIPLWTAAEGLKIATRDSREVMQRLVPEQLKYRSDLVSELGWKEDRLDDSLRELQWLGAVEIRDFSRRSNFWRILRAI